MGKINHEDTKTLRFSQEFNDGTFTGIFTLTEASCSISKQLSGSMPCIISGFLNVVEPKGQNSR